MRGRKGGMRMREREGTQADPLVSEICLLMFGLGKWKLLWRVHRINPSFLIPGGDVGEERVIDVYTEGKEGDVVTKGPHLTHERRKKNLNLKCPNAKFVL